MQASNKLHLSSAVSLYDQHFSSLGKALTEASKLTGSEAVIKNTNQDGSTYYTLKPISQNEIQQYGSSGHDPSMVQFVIAPSESTQENTANEVIRANALACRNDLEAALKTVIPISDFSAASLNQLSRDLGFKDFKGIYQLLSKMPPDKKSQFVQILSNPSVWQNYPNSGNITQQLRTELNHFLKTEIESLFETKGLPSFSPQVNNPESSWSPSALLGIYNSLHKVKTESPTDFMRIQSAKNPFVFKAEEDPSINSTQEQGIAKDNPATQNPINLLMESMKIAHTSCTPNCPDQHEIRIRDGAVKGSADAILNPKILEKFSFFSRGKPNQFHEIKDFQANKSNGVNHWYTLAEMQTRGLVSGQPPSIQRQNTEQLLRSLNQKDNLRDQVWQQFNALANSTGVFQPDLLSSDPLLQKYMKPDNNGILDLSKIRDVFFPNGNKPEIEKIKQALDLCLAKSSNQVLVNTVFQMEQMNQVQSLQNFLNEIKPGTVKDRTQDGPIGESTETDIQRLEGIITLNALRKNLPQPLSHQHNQAIKDILSTLTSQSFNKQTQIEVQQQMKLLLNSITDRTVQESPRKTLHEVLNRLIERTDGIFNIQSTKDLVDSWLAMVDSEGEGNISSELVTHEIGHNLMEIYKKEHPTIASLSKDWAAISGKDTTGSDGFGLNKATRSFFNQASEEVSDYGETNPDEDFAESYRLFISQPEELLKRAPTKFLVINALSGRFSSTELEKQFGKQQYDLKKAWDKIQGYSGPQFHLSEPLVTLMNKTYGSVMGLTAPPVEQKELFPGQEQQVENNLATLSQTPPLSNERLKTLLSLEKLALTEEELNKTNQAIIKLISHVQKKETNLSAESIKEILKEEYDYLPIGLKTQFTRPSSFLMQYINNPSHVGRTASPQWVQNETWNQLATNYEVLNTSRKTAKGLLENLFIKGKDRHNPNTTFLNKSAEQLQIYLEYNSSLQPTDTRIPSKSELAEKIKAMLLQVENPTALIEKLTLSY